MSYPTEVLKCYRCLHRMGTPIELHQHQMNCHAVIVTPVDRWGRRPFFQAKVGTQSGTLILVKGARRSGQPFEVNDRIEFAEWSSLQGMATCCTPAWQPGHIWKIEDNRLFVNR